MDTHNNNKRIIALSTAHYRGIPLYELADGSHGVGIFLGLFYHVFAQLKDATAFIDHWFDLKNN